MSPAAHPASDIVGQAMPRLRSIPMSVRWVPFAALAAAFWWVSSTPRPWVPLTFESSDKLMHACAYAGLGTLARVAVLEIRGAAAWAIALAAGYGLVDEFHQSFVPGRSSSWGDVAANATGAVLGVVLMTLLARAIVQRTRPVDVT